MNSYFSKEDMQLAKKHMKRCVASVALREMQIKIIMRRHFIPIGIAIIKTNKTQKITSVGKDVVKLEHMHCC